MKETIGGGGGKHAYEDWLLGRWVGWNMCSFFLWPEFSTSIRYACESRCHIKLCWYLIYYFHDIKGIWIWKKFTVFPFLVKESPASSITYTYYSPGDGTEVLVWISFLLRFSFSFELWMLKISRFYSFVSGQWSKSHPLHGNRSIAFG